MFFVLKKRNKLIQLVPVCNQGEHKLVTDLRYHQGFAPVVAVDSRVHAYTEEVLVNLGIDAWRHDGAVLWQRALPLAQNAGAQDAGQLGLILDRPIRVEVLHRESQTFH